MSVGGWRPAVVRARRRETASAVSLRLNVAGWPGHQAGQHVDVRLTAQDGYQAQRAYSIASAPEHPDVTLTVDRVDDGEVSPYLVDEIAEGDELELRGPVGGYFTWRASQGGPLLLVGGGSGFVPLMAILRHRAAAGSTAPTAALLSTRSLDDVFYREELAKLGADPTLRLVQTFTRTPPPGWRGRTRRVDAAMLAEVGFAPGAAPFIYVCGPTRFVEAVASALAGQGHPPERIRTERFGPGDS